MSETLRIDSAEQGELMRICDRLRGAIERAIGEMADLGMTVDDIGDAVNETVVQADWPESDFDHVAIREFAAEMQASTGDDLGPMIWRDVQRLADGYEQLLRCVEAPSDDVRRTPPREDESV